MKNLFATVSYSFDNFYNNLNTQGQMIFSLIMLLIGVLCILLLITYIIQGIQSKARLKRLKNEITEDKILTQTKAENITYDEKKPLYNNAKTEIEDIADAIKDALNEDAPINLTNFEEDQEKTAIISIDELMQRAKELELIDDEENTGVNYLEKYNLEPAEVQKVSDSVNKGENKTEVKAFKVSQVISPIYGVKKEVINNENK